MKITGGAKASPATSWNYHYQWHNENVKCWELNPRPQDKTLSTSKTDLPGEHDYSQWNA